MNRSKHAHDWHWVDWSVGESDIGTHTDPRHVAVGGTALAPGGLSWGLMPGQVGS